jgi:hypothetical protein
MRTSARILKLEIIMYEYNNLNNNNHNFNIKYNKDLLKWTIYQFHPAAKISCLRNIVTVKLNAPS